MSHRDARLQAALATRFRRLGAAVAAYPRLTLIAAIAAVAVCMAGLVALRVETSPLKLWVPPGSRAARDKAAYDAAFGPFYRIEQLVISTPVRDNGTRAPILSHDALELVRGELFNSRSAIWPCAGCRPASRAPRGRCAGSPRSAHAGVRPARRGRCD